VMRKWLLSFQSSIPEFICPIF